ncbi:hypothetical protein GGP41_007810 [Bipolaris sorokiniana]|uniref:Uncharacterized protein n=1 Tax=Cochliobolus sativus TaxID=45130 RepID=A0A8H5ZNR0_COCSA|nr:hypothetical protein GGP41_007810 [Bipolaris sorokiniana]
MSLSFYAGALLEAYRLIYLRLVRAFARKVYNIDYYFGAKRSKKLEREVLEYVKAEFAVFLAAMDLVAAARHSNEPDDD